MATKFYRDSDGNYLGGFDGALPPEGAIEIPEPPPHGACIWNGTEWTFSPELQETIDADQKKDLLEKSGATLEARIQALEDAVYRQDTTKADAINTTISTVDAQLSQKTITP